MKVRLVLLEGILAAAGAPPLCLAQDIPRLPPGWEVGADASYQLANDVAFESGTQLNFTDEFGLGLEIGYRFNPRFELQFSIDWNSVDYRVQATDVTGTVESIAPRLNGIFNVMEGALTPFLSAGIGCAWMDNVSPWAARQSDTSFTYQAGAGLRWDITQQMAVKFAYEKTWVEMRNAVSTTGLDQLRLVFAYRE